MEEIFKTIEGTDGIYQVSNFGNVTRNGEPVKQVLDNGGYVKVNIGLVIGARNFNVHRLVAVYFCEGRSEEKNYVNHIDGNKENNHSDNLEWVTNTENQRHRIDILGKGCKGENNPMYGVKGADSPVFKGYINKVDPKTKKILGTYAGSGEAARANGYNASNILRVVNKDTLYHGFLWTREDL